MCKYKLNVFALAILAALPAYAEITQLDEVQVIGSSEGQRYYSNEGGVVRSDTPLKEVPQSVRVVPRQVIDDIGAVKLEQAYDYISGISRQNDFGGMWDNFSIRGFSGHENTGPNFLRNGFAGNRGFNAPRDMANVERLEVLKGPSSALYGGSEPGGVLNIVTKKPKFKAENAVEVSAGSYDNYRMTVDSTAPLSDTVAYRINAAYEDKGSFRDYVDSQRFLIAPSVTWLVGANTVLNYDYEVLRQKAPMDRGVIAINGHVGSIPRERFLGEPNDGDTTIQNQTHNLTLEHEFSTDWKARAGVSYRNSGFNGYVTEASARTVGNVTWTAAGEPVIERQRVYRDYSSNDVSFQGEIHGKFKTGLIGHEVLTGVDSYRFKIDQLMLRGRSNTEYGLDIYNPVYNQTPVVINTTVVNSLEIQHDTGLFAQDQLTLGQNWRALAGLRHDFFDQDLTNRRTAVRTKQSHGVTTPRAGLTWLATKQLSVYTLASESFRANTGTDAAGQAFAPERGESKEVGMKFESSDQKLGGTIALFDIEKKNVLTNDPNNSGYSVAAGRARSRGVELDLSGQVSERIRLLASYALTNAKITESNTASLVGARLINVPKHSGSTLAMYEDGFVGGRFGVGAGATYVGARAGNSTDTFELPAYTTFRSMAYWQPKKSLRFSLDVENLFDKVYYASSYDAAWITPGTPRTITAAMQAKF